MIEYEIKCKHCKRFLATTNKTVELQLKCSNSKCKKLDNYKVVFMSDFAKQHNHDKPRTV